MSQKPTSADKKTVVDFSEVRAQKLEEKRRKAERIFFKQILGIYCVVDNEEIRPLEVIDVSEEGCSFQIPFTAENPWPRETKDLPLRLYFSQDTYLPINVTIQNSRPAIENGVRYIRYGCKVDQSTQSFEAYQQFIRFLRLYAEHAHKDNGRVTFFYL